MTAIEIINKATMLPTSASMLETINARKGLRMIENAITNEEIVNNWRDAMAHINMIDEDRAAKAANGIRVRIM